MDDTNNTDATAKTFTITTDSGAEAIDASDADKAAASFAAGEGLRGIATADDLCRYVERAGGYGIMTGPDGEIWRVAR